MAGSNREVPPVPVVVIDRRERARRGLVALLETCPDLRVLGHGAWLADMVRLARGVRRPVLLVDMNACGPDAAAAVRDLRSLLPDAAVVLTTLHPALVEQADAANADAVLLKGGPVNRLLRALEHVVEARRRDPEPPRTPSGPDSATTPSIHQET